MKTEYFYTLLLALITLSCTQHQNTITDLIKPVTLKQGAITKLDLSDLFYADNYDVSFLPNNNFDIEVSKGKKIVEITALNNFSGLDLVSFSISPKTFAS